MQVKENKFFLDTLFRRVLLTFVLFIIVLGLVNSVSAQWTASGCCYFSCQYGGYPTQCVNQEFDSQESCQSWLNSKISECREAEQFYCTVTVDAQCTSSGRDYTEPPSESDRERELEDLRRELMEEDENLFRENFDYFVTSAIGNAIHRLRSGRIDKNSIRLELEAWGFKEDQVEEWTDEVYNEAVDELDRRLAGAKRFTDVSANVELVRPELERNVDRPVLVPIAGQSEEFTAKLVKFGKPHFGGQTEFVPDFENKGFNDFWDCFSRGEQIEKCREIKSYQDSIDNVLNRISEIAPAATERENFLKEFEKITTPEFRRDLYYLGTDRVSKEREEEVYETLFDALGLLSKQDGGISVKGLSYLIGVNEESAQKIILLASSEGAVSAKKKSDGSVYAGNVEAALREQDQNLQILRGCSSSLSVACEGYDEIIASNERAACDSLSKMKCDFYKEIGKREEAEGMTEADRKISEADRHSVESTVARDLANLNRFSESERGKNLEYAEKSANEAGEIYFNLINSNQKTADAYIGLSKISVDKNQFGEANDILRNALKDTRISNQDKLRIQSKIDDLSDTFLKSPALAKIKQDYEKSKSDVAKGTFETSIGR